MIYVETASTLRAETLYIIPSAESNKNPCSSALLTQLLATVIKSAANSSLIDIICPLFSAVTGEGKNHADYQVLEISWQFSSLKKKVTVTDSIYTLCHLIADI